MYYYPSCRCSNHGTEMLSDLPSEAESVWQIHDLNSNRVHCLSCNQFISWFFLGWFYFKLLSGRAHTREVFRTESGMGKCQ